LDSADYDQALRAAQQNLPSMPFQLLGSDMVRVGCESWFDPIAGIATGFIQIPCGWIPVVHAQRG
jgi:glutaconate CoA-transferase subunit A